MEDCITSEVGLCAKGRGHGSNLNLIKSPTPITKNKKAKEHVKYSKWMQLAKPRLW